MGKQLSAGIRANQVITLIVGVVVLFSLVLNAGLFVMLKNYSQAQSAAAAKLEEISKSIEGNRQQVTDVAERVKNLAGDFQGVNEQLSAAKSGIEGLRGLVETQNSAIEILTKAKDTLFSRVSNLETELEKVKQKIPAAVSQVQGAS